MANAQVLYAEDVAATVATDTNWVDVASIPASSFTAGKKYLILANQVSSTATSSQEARVRLVHGTTPTVFDDASCAYEAVAATEHETSYMFFFTQPGTAELVKLQISGSSTTDVINILSQIIAIKLSDDFTENTDYFLNELLTDYTMTSTPTAKAITSSFTPNGTDRWLFIGHMIYDVVSIVDEIGFELYDSVAGVLGMSQAEGEDATNDFRAENLFWVGVPSNSARTLAVRPFNEAGSNVMLASRVFAINLSKFAQSASVFDATEVDPASSPSYTTVATIAPNPTNTGNWVVIAFSTNDVNDNTLNECESRLQINASGGGLASSPNYATTPPSIDGWDNLDELPFSVFNLISLTSGAGRTINYDWRKPAGTTQRIEDNGLVAFSVALAATGTQYNQSVSGGMTPSGGIIKDGIKTLAGTLTSSSTLNKASNKLLSGSNTPSGSIVKLTNKAFSGSISSIIGVLTTSRGYIKDLAGTLTSSGVESVQVDKVLSGTITSTGTIIKAVAKAFGGTFIIDGTLSKQTNKILAGAISLLTGTLQAIKVALVSIGGSLITSGSLNKETNKILSGQLTTSGTIVKGTQKILSGIFSSLVGSLNSSKFLTKFIEGTLTSFGSITKNTSKNVAGNLSLSGAIKKQTTKLLSGIINFIGNLVAIIAGLEEIPSNIYLKGTLESNSLLKGELESGVILEGKLANSITLLGNK